MEEEQEEQEKEEEAAIEDEEGEEKESWLAGSCSCVRYGGDGHRLRACAMFVWASVAAAAAAVAWR